MAGKLTDVWRCFCPGRGSLWAADGKRVATRMTRTAAPDASLSVRRQILGLVYPPHAVFIVDAACCLCLNVYTFACVTCFCLATRVRMTLFGVLVYFSVLLCFFNVFVYAVVYFFLPLCVFMLLCGVFFKLFSVSLFVVCFLRSLLLFSLIFLFIPHPSRHPV